MGLEELRAECLKCEKCGLCATRHNVVFGVGNPKTDVLFIGEGPGENEDLKGEPFVGRGGQLLDKMLSVVDLSRDKNIYIANMVKCRPPQNRDPEEEEVAACRQWLQKQIEFIDPKIIVCLGRVAAIRFIDPNFKVTKEHGQWTLKDGIWRTALYHPAALLRDPHKKPDTFLDLKSIQAKILEVCDHTY